MAATLGAGVLVCYLLARLFTRFLKRYWPFDELKQLRIPLTIIFMGWVWFWSLRVVHLTPSQLDHLATGTKLLSYIGITLFIWNFADVIKAYVMASVAKSNAKLDALLIPLITRLVRLVAILFAALSMAELFNLPIASLLTGLGIGGVAVAMAAKETVGNIFGSMNILFDRPFQLGDSIKVAGYEGEVEEVGFRSTRIRTPHDSVVTIPNSNLQTTYLDNMGARRSVVFEANISLVVTTPPAQIAAFCAALEVILYDQKETRKNSVQVGISNVTPAAGIGIRVHSLFKAPDGPTEFGYKHQVFLAAIQQIEALKLALHAARG